MVKRGYTVCILVLGIVLLQSTPSLALKITQIEFDLTLPQGASSTHTFKVQNDEAEPTTVKVKVADWYRKTTGKNVFIKPNSLKRSCSDWISVNPKQFALQPQGSKEVRFTIKVPDNIKGTYWCAIMVEGEPARIKTQQGTTVVVRKRFGVKIYETPPGTAQREVKITDLKTKGLNPLTIMISLKNVGNAHLTIGGESKVEVRDQSGKTIQQIKLKEVPMLPGATRELKLVGERKKGDLLPPGEYQILAMIDYGGHVLSGKQARLTIEKLNLQPVGNSDNLPQDLDGDGFYEDINGDGKLTAQDPPLLGFNLDNPAATENWRAFDFNNDGLLDFKDVQTLKEMVKAERD